LLFVALRASPCQSVSTNRKELRVAAACCPRDPMARMGLDAQSGASDNGRELGNRNRKQAFAIMPVAVTVGEGVGCDPQQDEVVASKEPRQCACWKRSSRSMFPADWPQLRWLSRFANCPSTMPSVV
jgi:hypothetical protein